MVAWSSLSRLVFDLPRGMRIVDPRLRIDFLDSCISHSILLSLVLFARTQLKVNLGYCRWRSMTSWTFLRNCRSVGS